MGHIKTNKTLHLTEILTLLKSFNNYLQSTEDKPSQTSSSFFKNNWFLGLNSVISLQRLPRTTLFELICRVYAVNRFSKHRRGTARACMEFPLNVLNRNTFKCLVLSKRFSVREVVLGKLYKAHYKYLKLIKKQFLDSDRVSRNLIGSKPVCNYYLLTGCKGRTRKYKPKVFHTARACEGCLENQGLVFPGTARAPS